MLHESWNNIRHNSNLEGNKYREGALDFQEKALEKLQSMINTAPELNMSGIYQADLHKVIEIIKNLKVE